MTFESALVAHLTGDSSIVAMVGDRIRPLRMKQGETKPCITYQRVNGVPDTDLDGGDGSRLAVRVQIDCWAGSFDDVARLAEAVRTRLQTSASTLVAVLNMDQDFYEDDVRLYRRMLDVSFGFRIT